MPPTKYDKKDAQEDTNSSRREVQEAWHVARDDAQRSGEIDRGRDDDE